MVLLSVAVAILTVLVLIDLVLSAAVIRRLRDTERQLIEITTPPQTGLAPGAAMPDFTAPGGEVSRADLTGRPALVAFFSVGCRHCPAQAERLAERADDLSARGVTVLSVLGVTDGEDELSALLRKAGRLVTEPGFGPLATAFQVDSTPTLLMFDEAGVLVANGHGVDEVLGGR